MTILLKRHWTWLLIFCVGFIVLFADSLYAADAANGTLDQIIDTFKVESKRWAYSIQERAKWLFWVLAIISLVLKFIPMATGGYKGDAGDFFKELAQFVLVTGFFYWLIQLSSKLRPGDYDLVEMFIRSFQQMGAEASSYGAAETLSPSGIVTLGLDTFSKILKTVSIVNIPTAFAMVITGLAILIVFVMIAAKMCIILIGAWVMAYGGVIFLGFGGSYITRDMAINYIKACVGMGVKVMVFCLLVGFGKTYLDQVCNAAFAIKEVETVRIHTQGMVMAVNQATKIPTNLAISMDILVILAIGLVLLILLMEVPDLVAGLVSGSHVGGMASTVTMGSAMHLGGQVIGAATGGAGNVVGAASAVKSAALQAGAQLQAGEGFFKGSSGAGEKGLAGGFARAMGTDGMMGGASFASRSVAALAANILGGTKTAIESKGSRSTMGEVANGVKVNSAREDNQRALASSGGTGPAVSRIDSSSPSAGGIITAGGSVSMAPTATASNAAANSIKATSANESPAEGSKSVTNGATGVSPLSEVQINEMMKGDPHKE